MKTVFGQLADNIRSIDILKFWKDFLDSDLTYDRLILASQRNRLSQRGVDIFQAKLRTYKARFTNVYSEYTIALKESKGQRTDIVTLQDEGNFYKSFELIRIGNEALIIGEDKKADGNISDNVDISNVLGWTDSDIEILVEYIQPLFIEYVLDKFLKF